MRTISMVRNWLLLFAACALVAPAQAQMTRERAAEPVAAELFLAPTAILSESVANLPAGNINFSIMHVFGPVSTGADDLFGLDGTANIRFGFDMGLTDRLSVGFGRSRFDKQYDFRAKASLVRATRPRPVAVSLKGDVGIVTVRNGFEFADRLNYFAGALVAARLTDGLVVQLTPMVGHYNTVYITRNAAGDRIEQRNTQVGLGAVVRYALSDRLALMAEAMPVLAGASDATTTAVALGLDIETGGHVFQLFVSTSDWLTEQATLARNDDDAGDVRFGFIVNRVFGLQTP